MNIHSKLCPALAKILDLLSFIKDELIDDQPTPNLRILLNDYYELVQNTTHLIVTDADDELVFEPITNYTKVIGYGVTQKICDRPRIVHHRRISASNKEGDLYPISRLLTTCTDIKEANQVSYLETICELIEFYTEIRESVL